MRTPLKTVAVACLAAATSPTVWADGLNPGSVLIYPIQRTASFQAGGPIFSLIAVTNVNLLPVTPQNGLGGSTNIHYEYVNTLRTELDTKLPYDCVVVDRIELLTPADTRSVITNCHNATIGAEGYLVISAQDPNQFNVPWSHNYLIGSELVVNGNGLTYYVNAIPFESPLADGSPTDIDADGQLDFDGMEYEGVPEHLYLDTFTGMFNASIALINLSGGFQFTADVKFDVWNDNEFALSATTAFKCWMEEELGNISVVFLDSFLRNNTPHDPSELDLTCTGGTIEVGWARIRGLTARSTVESYPNPALLGAYAKAQFRIGGRRMWETPEKQFNGDFFKTGTDDPEFP